MTAHAKASQSGRLICDLLLSLINRDVEASNRNEAKKCCSIGIKTRFAYAYHRRGGLRVYLYSKESDGPRLTALAMDGPVKLLKRRSMGSPWAKLSPYFIELDSEPEVRAAIPLLVYVASQLELAPAKHRPFYLQPSEIHDIELLEGARTSVEVSRIERDPAARKKCIEIFGALCFVCGFDFERTYGEIGVGFIHVHHLNPLAAAKGRRKVDPKTDLRPVCPNCHEMVHKQNPPFMIDQLKAMLSR